VASPINWADFEKVDMRVGRVKNVEPYPEAHRPSYLLQIDFGAEIGVKNSIAAIREQYSSSELIGRSVVAVVNFPPRQIGKRRSYALVLAAVSDSGALRLLQPDKEIALGSRVR
jgi:tRNA-binding protein